MTARPCIRRCRAGPRRDRRRDLGQFHDHSDDGLGLFILNAPNRDGYHIGVANHHAIVWVDCAVTSDFDPEPAVGWGPLWYRVHWPNTERSDASASSSPSDPSNGYAFGYYLRPSGTNGRVPICD